MLRFVGWKTKVSKESKNAAFFDPEIALYEQEAALVRGPDAGAAYLFEVPGRFVPPLLGNEPGIAFQPCRCTQSLGTDIQYHERLPLSVPRQTLQQAGTPAHKTSRSMNAI